MVKPRKAWTALRLVGVGQVLMGSVLAVSMEMHVGVTVRATL